MAYSVSMTSIQLTHDLIYKTTFISLIFKLISQTDSRISLKFTSYQFESVTQLMLVHFELNVDINLCTRSYSSETEFIFQMSVLFARFSDPLKLHVCVWLCILSGLALSQMLKLLSNSC